jgi:hypothetical protein
MDHEFPTAATAVVYSRLTGREAHAPAVRAYLAFLAHNPVVGSYFDLMTRDLRARYPGELILPVLADAGYDALLWLDEQGVYASTIFVAEGGEARMFRVLVREGLENRGIGTQAVSCLMTYIWRTLCLPRLQIGQGGDAKVCVIYDKIVSCRVNVSVRFQRADNWYLIFM